MTQPKALHHKRIKAYVTYKAVSADLFTPIEGKDLTNLHQWDLAQRIKYHQWLIKGYVVNKLCYERRVYFRDTFNTKRYQQQQRPERYQRP
ncbi:hypothetical protein HDV00_001019 [Rhizophlyctis rosea]|nr:hypothetical protein HDV00_001019 [Rhizophlyctis rosea]